MNILFLCVANSARSQMAEGLARKIFAERTDIHVYSAGTKPTSVHPRAVSVLKEVGVDISQHTSKSVDEFLSKDIDYVITLCAEEQCPVFPGPIKKIHWPMPDPAIVGVSEAEALLNFRKTRDKLAEKLEEFFKIVQASQ